MSKPPQPPETTTTRKQLAKNSNGAVTLDRNYEKQCAQFKSDLNTITLNQAEVSRAHKAKLKQIEDDYSEKWYAEISSHEAFLDEFHAAKEKFQKHMNAARKEYQKEMARHSSAQGNLASQINTFPATACSHCLAGRDRNTHRQTNGARTSAHELAATHEQPCGTLLAVV